MKLDKQEQVQKWIFKLGPMIIDEKETSVKNQIEEESIVEESEICEHKDELRRPKIYVFSKKIKHIRWNSLISLKIFIVLQ